jgi:dTDP-4-dehydrorhamnose 3,5-epimerase/CDP-3, 6-dideoxy-D-glycero-D-glycero-4-hexulose-5-epimerase
MKIVRELLRGAWLLELNHFKDLRGSFVKTFTRSFFDEHTIPFDFSEEFYSTSKKNVIRGMHFQMPPFHHEKLVYCAVGAVLDVLLDLRIGPDYGRTVSLELIADNPSLLYIPKGVAHGFYSLTEGSLMIYKTSMEHVPAHDAGIRWDSFGFDWKCASPILSERDLSHSSFHDFETPFVL